jgi:hypothetical protein
VSTATRSSTSIDEQLAIHTAVCRARRAGLACGTCSQLAERVARTSAAVAMTEAA